MTADTPISAITYPQNTDAPNIPNHMSGMATDLDRILIPRYSSASARDTAIPSPTDGMLCYRTDTSQLEHYRGSYGAWQPHRARLMKAKTASTSRASTTTLSNDPHIAGISYKANKLYSIEGVIVTWAATTADTKVNLQFSSTPQDFSWAIRFRNDASFSVDSNQSETHTASVVIPGRGATGGEAQFAMVEGFFLSNSTTPGTIDLRWAQNTSSATATVVFLGSWISINQIN